MSSTNYVCDTIPAARLAAGDKALPQPIVVREERKTTPLNETPRKLCVRHQRMADEGTNLKLQQSLDALPFEERETVNTIWSSFSSSSHSRRELILHGLLTMCCFSQLSLLTEQLAHIIRIDPFAILPREVCLKILGNLDAMSLCRAAQVTKKWKALADDDILWRGICEQHIGQKCHKCGWGLPVLEKKRAYRKSPSPGVELLPAKRPMSDDSCDSRPAKRPRSHSPTANDEQMEARHALLAPTLVRSSTRPWKDVYSERLTIERNWRRGRCTVRTLKGHTDGVMCLQFSETMSNPDFPVLITGSYDRTARVWNLETGAQLHCLKGHSRAVRALQFDHVKLITGSMDHTLKVWDWRRGKCIRTLTGHTEGVVCLNFDSNVLASGSVDSTIKVWNLRTGGAFTLRGHSDWVNSVQLWDSSPSTTSSPPSSLAALDDVGSPSPCSSAPQIDPGKMLFSASDDGTIKLWDLTLRTCVRAFTGHVGQVQSMKLLLADQCGDDDPDDKIDESDRASQTEAPSVGESLDQQASPLPTRKKPLLISGSLDNTIKLWDIDTGETLSTFFGHIEGVWAVASDKLRLVSGSHDRTIKVWSREEGKCTATLVGHRGAVSCLALGEDKIVSGSDDWDVKVWSFSGW
ncbi:quinon protein alcohol dehydrogenase-like superfamily [Roridomyces roridus]|uniref:Quinon protein alcohol dehydrogenase-like superfamily n=1 Tax=Roridomyces roridus TaxID=1738132 RepID=A0AAD7AWW6_9AGAR|nr:quinon protein alcohol dehydrogenase-like superfamily [Roridomyces roridus]